MFLQSYSRGTRFDGFSRKGPWHCARCIDGELLGDVGHVPDEVKPIPKLLKQSMHDTLNLVADAVEDAEDTVFELQKQTKQYAEAAVTKAGLDLGVQLSNAIHTSLDQAFEPALLRASSELENLENLITKASGSLRDTHATRFNYII
jgi:flavin-binding protein dodecin